MNKTFISPTLGLTSQWFIINAENQILGRFASQISQFLLNKYNSFYTPFLLPKLYLIIINSNKIVINRNKLVQKKYLTYSGYQGGLHFKTFYSFKKVNSNQLLRKAIKGMLCKNFLGRCILSKLKIYKKNNHLHCAQQPICLTFSF